LVLIDEIEVNQHLPIGNYNQKRNDQIYMILFRIRTRVFAQGFVVSLLTAAAIYHTVKDKPDHHDIHGHKISHHESSSANDHNKSQ
jgi:hypothetical protein